MALALEMNSFNVMGFEELTNDELMLVDGGINPQQMYALVMASAAGLGAGVSAGVGFATATGSLTGGIIVGVGAGALTYNYVYNQAYDAYGKK